MYVLDELDRRATDTWLDTVPVRVGGSAISTAEVVEAVHAARDDVGAR